MRRANILMNQLFKELKNYINSNEEINISFISRKFSIDRKTARKYINIIKSNNKLCPKEIVKIKYDDINKHINLINEKINYGCKLQHIYNYLKINYDIKFSYQYLTKFLRDKKIEDKFINSSESTVIFEKLPGTQAQVDWKENFSLISRSGKKFTFNVFLYKLSFSKKCQMFLTLDKKQDTVIRCLIKAFESTGGVPKEIVFDNMKTVVYEPNSKDRADYVINEKFLQFSKDFNFNIYACKVRRPQTKGKIESLAKCVDELKVFNREFETLEELNNLVINKQNELNNRIHRSTGVEPNNLFNKYEINELIKNRVNPLIIDNYLTNSFQRKVNSQSMISYMNNHYSVPVKYISKDVTCQIKNSWLIIKFNDEIITKHNLVDKNIKYHKSIKESHLLQLNKKVYNDRNLSTEIIQASKETLNTLKLFLDYKTKKVA